MRVIVELGNHRREVEFAERGMDIGGTLVGWRFVIKEGCPPLFGVGAKVLGSRLTAVGEVFQGRLPSVDANPLVMVPPLIRGTSQGRSRSLFSPCPHLGITILCNIHAKMGWEVLQSRSGSIQACANPVFGNVHLHL